MAVVGLAEPGSLWQTHPHLHSHIYTPAPSHPNTPRTHTHTHTTLYRLTVPPNKVGRIESSLTGIDFFIEAATRVNSICNTCWSRILRTTEASTGRAKGGGERRKRSSRSWSPNRIRIRLPDTKRMCDVLLHCNFFPSFPSIFARDADITLPSLSPLSSPTYHPNQVRFKIGDVVWAKMEGFSAWPGQTTLPPDGLKRPILDDTVLAPQHL